MGWTCPPKVGDPEAHPWRYVFAGQAHKEVRLMGRYVKLNIGKALLSKMMYNHLPATSSLTGSGFVTEA